MKRRVWFTLVVWLVSIVLLTACDVDEAAESVTDVSYKVAYFYAGSPGDSGWTHEHDRGRQWVEQTFGGSVETAYVEGVPESSDAGRILRQYAQEGYAIIFVTSPDYIDVVREVSEEFPRIKFEQCASFETRANLSAYFGRMYQPRYLSGVVAGRMTTSGNIGYVAAFSVPEVIRGINAFTRGVRWVNPGANVHVVWTHDLTDPDESREAAITLLDAGADVIAQHVDNTEPQKAAQERGMVSIGSDSDMRLTVGDSVLTSVVWNWGNYYAQTIQRGIDDAWVQHTYWGGLESGVVGLADFSPKVPQDVRDFVALAEMDILAGNDVFCGPVRTQSGVEIVPTGTCMSDADLLEMQFFVEGVVGIIP